MAKAVYLLCRVAPGWLGAIALAALAGCASGSVVEAEEGSLRDSGAEADAREDADTGRRPDTREDTGRDTAADAREDADTRVDTSTVEPDTGDDTEVDTAPDIDTTPVICEATSCGVGTGNECCTPGCNDANECVTVGNECPDVCGGQSLIVGRDCLGCGSADAAGSCGGGRESRCDAESANQCATETCGGTLWYCTKQGGAWGWTTAPRCDDGDSCTTDDVCSGGTCGGTGYTCGGRACGSDRCEGATFVDLAATCDTSCDGAGGCSDCVCEERREVCARTTSSCCAPACDAARGCVTVTGGCGGTDACGDPNRLTVAGVCQGCGPAEADGVCAGAGTFVCDNATHTPCEQVSCGGVVYTCSNQGGSWAWSTSASCDDGNACTHDDRCAAGTCAGAAVTCTSTDCVQRTCNGTASCTESIRGGATCDDGNACTVGERCDGAGRCVDGVSTSTCGDGACTCGETLGSCASDCTPPLPANACSTGSQSRDGCGSARVIGRRDAATGWSSGEQNTCSARDRHDDACPSFDVGFDHSYALYLRAGERVVAELGVTSGRCASGEEFHSFLKFKFNPDSSASGAGSCPSFVACAGGPYRTQTYTALRDYVATSDGWLFVIIDGGATAFDEHRGYYNLRVTLSRCADGSCGC
jgi:hypothetical protein